MSEKTRLRPTRTILRRVMRSDQVAAILFCSAVVQSTWSVRDDQNYSARCKALGANGPSVNHPSTSYQKSAFKVSDATLSVVTIRFCGTLRQLNFIR